MTTLALSAWCHKLGVKGLVKTWKRRWLVLKDGSVFYYKAASDKLPKGVINLNTATNVAIVANNFGKKSGCGLQINTPKRDWYLIFESDEVAETWVSRLNEARVGRNRNDLETQYDSFSKEELIALLIDKDNELVSCKKELYDLKQSARFEGLPPMSSARGIPGELSRPIMTRSEVVTLDAAATDAKPSRLRKSILVSNLAKLKL
eukprot:TRINITY_DN215_c0_g3_i1.p1 TRINITY_DN215_c0_g3~~TRINITY_DN215_c0_g3_i1.p1  ORF type:complete len:222 (-),score=56.97 TRINITY_DN215_c0_g3_i1:170-784(-)